MKYLAVRLALVGLFISTIAFLATGALAHDGYFFIAGCFVFALNVVSLGSSPSAAMSWVLEWCGGAVGSRRSSVEESRETVERPFNRVTLCPG